MSRDESYHPDVNESDEGIIATSDTEALDNSEKRSPLSGEEFREVLQRIDALGLTWTEEIPPLMKPKEPRSLGTFEIEGLDEIIERHPNFLAELGLVMANVLLGTEVPSRIIGTEEDLRIKVEATSALVITAEFRHEFFFKNSLKVPHFSNIDWEVSIKVFERGIESIPIMPYALISIDIQESLNQNVGPDKITFAVDEKRIHKLIAVLKEAQTNLEKSRRIKETLEIKHFGPGEKNDA